MKTRTEELKPRQLYFLISTNLGGLDFEPQETRVKPKLKSGQGLLIILTNILLTLSQLDVIQSPKGHLAR